MLKERLLRKLYAIQMEIVKANDEQLDRIGIELVDIEKKLLAYKQVKHTKSPRTIR